MPTSPDKYYLYTPTVSSRRTIRQANKILPIEREAYSSLFYYGAEMKEYYMSENTVSGYSDKVYGEYFILDIDDEDVDALTIRCERFFEDIKDLKYYLWFSGNKGFHVYIPKEYVNYPINLEDKWNIASHLFAQKIRELYPEIKDSVDLSVYDKVRIFRLPFSIHPKSGRKKALIKWSKLDAEYPTRSFITPIFRKEEILQEILNGKPCPEAHRKMVTIEETDIPKHKEINIDTGVVKSYVEYPYGEKLCIYKMLNTYDLTGMRHKVALRLQSYWKEKGYNKEFVWNMLKVWNERLTNPMSPAELDNIIKFYDRGYIFTCNDDIKSHFCIKTCHLYKSKDISEDYIYQGNDYLSRYIEDMKASKDNYIYMEDMFPDWPLAPIKPGYVIVLAGGPGSGKTTFMLNMMNSFKKLKWLFLSIEMTGVDITDKFLKITETNWDDDISIQAFKNSMNHIITIDKPNIHIEEIKDYMNMMKSKTGIKPNAIVIDYLSLIASKGHNQTERAIHISRLLKQIAKELRVVIFVLSQVPKDLAGDGNIPLGLDAPKDSGEIVNMADMLWTCWRPNRNRGGDIKDDTIKIGIPKNRHGVAGYSMEFDFIGEKYQVHSSVPKGE